LKRKAGIAPEIPKNKFQIPMTMAISISNNNKRQTINYKL
jgi:hypothetical protein